jgi:glycosyltransferase involved in cell wall biosynthesis
MADIFAFTSLTDTQGLVLNEAAHAGLPIVWCDPEVNDVAKHTYNGLLARPKKRDVAKKLSMLIGDEALREKFSKHSKKQAAKFSEYKQAAKVASVIDGLL